MFAALAQISQLLSLWLSFHLPAQKRGEEMLCVAGRCSIAVPPIVWSDSEGRDLRRDLWLLCSRCSADLSALALTPPEFTGVLLRLEKHQPI